jgi:ABC-2 type transport system ATP-binding protein
VLYLHGVFAGYGDRVVLRGIELGVGKGLAVVLGPNGAGKTTLLRVCCGVLKPFKGSVTVNGVDIYASPHVKSLVSYLPHNPGLLEDVTALNNLLFYARIYGLSEAEAVKRVRELAELLEAEDLLEKKVKVLSRGQKKRIALIRALMHNPQVLLLDEPTDGLDPLIARKVREFVKSVSKELCIAYTSHNMYEASEIAESVIAIDRGEVVFRGTVDELKNMLGEIVIGFEVRGPREKVEEVFKSLGYEPQYKDFMWIVRVRSEDEVSTIVSELVKNGIKVLRVKEAETSLELFLERLRGRK